MKKKEKNGDIRSRRKMASGTLRKPTILSSSAVGIGSWRWGGERHEPGRGGVVTLGGGEQGKGLNPQILLVET